MSFRFYTNMISQATRSAAAAIFIIGMLLIGFGVVILALPEIFAFLAAAVFFLAGTGCGITAIKIYLAQRRFDKLNDDENYSHKETIEIYPDEYTSDDN